MADGIWLMGGPGSVHRPYAISHEPLAILPPPALRLTTSFAAGGRRPLVRHRARRGSAGRRAAGL
jgi:hypothetical protein